MNYKQANRRSKRTKTRVRTDKFWKIPELLDCSVYVSVDAGRRALHESVSLKSDPKNFIGVFPVCRSGLSHPARLLQKGACLLTSGFFPWPVPEKSGKFENHVATIPVPEVAEHPAYARKLRPERGRTDSRRADLYDFRICDTQCFASTRACRRYDRAESPIFLAYFKNLGKPVTIVANEVPEGEDPEIRGERQIKAPAKTC
ncbi:hypothetical protein EVAR_90461_1 [Eumeta japonica]|uniref:Uncharacterized protein n=1 Tax=Eumeta variegata TaxID=151549 RepID=A0A4C1SHN5_EUMVA|nr:hypothetical protein EVAR_90461_1 [Eumeta japonica]